MPRTLIVYVFLSMSFLVCVNSSAEGLIGQIGRANNAFASAILNGDIDHLVNDYTEDACIVAPSTPKICGKESIRAFWTSVIASQPKNVEINTLAADGGSDFAYATGDLLITDAGGAVSENQFVLVFKKTDDGWKMRIDSWTPK